MTGRSLCYGWTCATTFQIDDDVEIASDDPFEQLVRNTGESEELLEADGNLPEAEQPQTSTAPPQGIGSTRGSATINGDHHHTPEPTTEANIPLQESPPEPIPEQKRLYEAAVGETFRNQRAKLDK